MGQGAMPALQAEDGVRRDEQESRDGVCHDEARERKPVQRP